MKEFWEQRYSAVEYAYGKTPNEFLAGNYQLLKQGRVLCLAEGEGRNAAFLATKGYEVTAVDQSKAGLQKITDLAIEFGVDIVTHEADLNDYDVGQECWDSIVSISAHLPPELRKEVHFQVVKALKPGGVLLLEAYHPKHIEMPGIGGPSAEQLGMFMTLDILKEELPGLEVVHAVETERELTEGEYHQGLSAVVQFVAKKNLMKNLTALV